jgi:hypothetical protein
MLKYTVLAKKNNFNAYLIYDYKSQQRLMFTWTQTNPT